MLLRLTPESFQTVNTATMTFPAELLVEYVRVYQRNGQQNIGCSPKDYPTADYINAHLPAYSSTFPAAPTLDAGRR